MPASTAETKWPSTAAAAGAAAAASTTTTAPITTTTTTTNHTSHRRWRSIRRIKESLSQMSATMRCMALQLDRTDDAVLAVARRLKDHEGSLWELDSSVSAREHRLNHHGAPAAKTQAAPQVESSSANAKAPPSGSDKDSAPRRSATRGSGHNAPPPPLGSSLLSAGMHKSLAMAYPQRERERERDRGRARETAEATSGTKCRKANERKRKASGEGTQLAVVEGTGTGTAAGTGEVEAAGQSRTKRVSTRRRVQPAQVGSTTSTACARHGQTQTQAQTQAQGKPSGPRQTPLAAPPSTMKSTRRPAPKPKPKPNDPNPLAEAPKPRAKMAPRHFTAPTPPPLPRRERPSHASSSTQGLGAVQPIDTVQHSVSFQQISGQRRPPRVTAPRSQGSRPIAKTNSNSTTSQRVPSRTQQPKPLVQKTSDFNFADYLTVSPIPNPALSSTNFGSRPSTLLLPEYASKSLGALKHPVRPKYAFPYFASTPQVSPTRSNRSPDGKVDDPNPLTERIFSTLAKEHITPALNEPVIVLHSKVTPTAFDSAPETAKSVSAEFNKDLCEITANTGLECAENVKENDSGISSSVAPGSSSVSDNSPVHSSSPTSRLIPNHTISVTVKPRVDIPAPNVSNASDGPDIPAPNVSNASDGPDVSDSDTRCSADASRQDTNEDKTENERLKFDVDHPLFGNSQPKLVLPYAPELNNPSNINHESYFVRKITYESQNTVSKCFQDGILVDQQTTKVVSCERICATATSAMFMTNPQAPSLNPDFPVHSTDTTNEVCALPSSTLAAPESYYQHVQEICDEPSRKTDDSGSSEHVPSRFSPTFSSVTLNVTSMVSSSEKLTLYPYNKENPAVTTTVPYVYPATVIQNAPYPSAYEYAYSYPGVASGGASMGDEMGSYIPSGAGLVAEETGYVSVRASESPPSEMTYVSTEVSWTPPTSTAAAPAPAPTAPDPRSHSATDATSSGTTEYTSSSSSTSRENIAVVAKRETPPTPAPPPRKPLPTLDLGSTPEDLQRGLIKAIDSGKPELVEMVLKKNVNLHFYHNGKPPLHRAASKNNPNIIMQLLHAGAAVDGTDCYGRTALHVSAFRDNYGLAVTLLVNAGADISARNSWGFTPLHYATNCGNETTVRALLAAGANPNLRDSKGRSPLDLAKTLCMHRLLRRSLGRNMRLRAARDSQAASGHLQRRRDGGGAEGSSDEDDEDDDDDDYEAEMLRRPMRMQLRMRPRQHQPCRLPLREFDRLRSPPSSRARRRT